MAPGDLGLGLVFLAGIVSFLSPCVLPLVPGYLSMLGGQAIGTMPTPRERCVVLRNALFFCLGFSLVFIALGASASLLGQVLRAYRFEANLVAGGVIVLFGAQMSGLFHLSRLTRHWCIGWPKGKGPMGSVTMGMAFAFGWTPCIGPVLGAILAAGAVSSTLSASLSLLATYALGLALPFLLVALFTETLVTRLRAYRAMGSLLHRLSGFVLMLVGVAMMTGTLNRLGTWMLATFPPLGNLSI